MADDPESMRWPTLAHKFGGARFFWWPCWNGVWIKRRDWYFGNYLMVSFGWFAFACGGGVYDEVPRPAAGDADA